ncbi:MAG TPA: aspartate kinase [Sedimentisphaerales bacterium]|nr:aspartate kinase [Sedimentisphaerales bacterium]
MAIIVQKFGGTSVANAEKIRAAAKKTIKAVKNGYQVVVVASARGKQTDQLVADALEINPDPSPREMDQLLHTGEIQTVALYAMALDEMGYDAISMTGYQIKMVTDNNHSKARIKSIDADRIHKYLNQGKIVLIAGFQGINDEEHVTTLGRGGSDTTAVAIAAVLHAEICEIYTDVDGIYTTDPRIFKDAAKINQISYDEMLEMASLGAGVMHSRSIEFGKNYNVKIHVRSSSEDKEGTIITHEVPQMEDIVVSGATIQKDLAKIGIIGVDHKPGNAAKIFSALATAKVVISDIIQTEINNEKANISFTTSTSDLKAAKKAVDSLKDALNFEKVFVREDIAAISVIGVGMRTHYGVADKMFNALAKEKINIDSISTSEICISCIVDEDQAEKALAAVCRAFDLDKPAEKRITKG